MRKTILASTLTVVALLGTPTVASAAPVAAGPVVAQAESGDGADDGDKSGLLGLLGLLGLAGLLRRKDNNDSHKH